MKFKNVKIITNNTFKKLLNNNPYFRKLLLILFDAIILPFSICLSIWIVFSEGFKLAIFSYNWLLFSSFFIGIIVYIFTGQYKSLTRYISSFSLYKILFRNGLLVFCLIIFGVLINANLPPRSTWFLLWIILSSLTGGYRILIRDFLLGLIKKRNKFSKVLIYGAGVAGAQLINAIRFEGYEIVKIIDDNSSLWNRSIDGIQIISPKEIERFLENIDQIFIAIPTLTRNKKLQILDQIKEAQNRSIPIIQIPSIDDITSGRTRIDNLKPISIDNLLSRNIVKPDKRILGKGIKNSNVCVTGAGGSIGSELCRQLLKLEPKKLVLIENNEYSLYKISQELEKIDANGTKLKTFLGSVTKSKFIEKIFLDNEIDIVFHAAAYKHVPLVENNPIEAIINNCFSTLNICKAASNCNLKNMLFISTDKAVRPTNVMGATKRLAEQIVCSFDNIEKRSKKQDFRTKFSMVRFGNVLGSSGSVVPLFMQQIKEGGPITITHKEITRYFMTIKEAVLLVIHSITLSRGGDIFLLDMGEPVKIKKLAEQMIILSGFKIKNEDNLDGDISIEYVGLRPGEKLYEELLIDAKSEPTEHHLIYRANEKSISEELLFSKLNAIEKLVEQQKTEETLLLLSECVPEWNRNYLNQIPES